LALASYLLYADAIGNQLEFDGMLIPAHLAAAISEDFSGDELFVSPVDNVARRILPEVTRFAGWVLSGGEDAVEGASLLCRRGVLGYEVGEAQGGSLLEIRTNLDLHLATMNCGQGALVEPIVLLLVSWEMGVRTLALSSRDGDKWGCFPYSLLAELGLDVKIRAYS
jgi:hypothetical protein